MPLNVERYINIFQSNSTLGGRDVQPMKGFSSHYASYDLAEHEDITHLNIEKMPTIHDQVLLKILQLTATPTKGGGDPLPIHLVVPADAKLDLWDSGTSVATHSGDTVLSIATEYRVPVSALTQISRLPQDVPVPRSFRFIVPQHLLPLAASTERAEHEQMPKH